MWQLITHTTPLMRDICMWCQTPSKDKRCSKNKAGKSNPCDSSAASHLGAESAAAEGQLRRGALQQDKAGFLDERENAGSRRDGQKRHRSLANTPLIPYTHQPTQHKIQHKPDKNKNRNHNAHKRIGPRPAVRSDEHGGDYDTCRRARPCEKTQTDLEKSAGVLQG